MRRFSNIEYKKLRNVIISRFFLVAIALGLLFFLPAGSLNYWEAWVFCGLLFIPMFFVLMYFCKNDPKLLERRMRMSERIGSQKLFVKLSLLIFAVAFIIPGLDYRFNWSEVPLPVVILSDVIIFLGYLLFFLVLKENSYASRIIEVEKGQKLITTGPYSVVRHPMYLGALLIYDFAPLALGSHWALPAVIPLNILIIFRIINEEELLIKEPMGYKEYVQKVKYRIIPFVW